MTAGEGEAGEPDPAMLVARLWEMARERGIDDEELATVSTERAKQCWRDAEREVWGVVYE